MVGLSPDKAGAEEIEEETTQKVLLAEVHLQPGVEMLLGSQYDPFKRRGLQYLRLIFRLQIKNVLNAKRYVDDPLIHVEENEFERC